MDKIDKADFEQALSNMKEDLERAKEFLIMPKASEYVIVGKEETDACFQLTAGYLSGRFAYNFAGFGLRTYVFASLEQASKTIIQERLRERYEMVKPMHRNDYVRGWIERQNKHIQFMEDALKDYDK